MSFWNRGGADRGRWERGWDGPRGVPGRRGLEEGETWRFARGPEHERAPRMQGREPHPMEWRGRDDGPRGRPEPGWGPVRYDRDFGYGAFGGMRDRGFDDRPFDRPDIYRGRDDRHRASEFGGYDRDMLGMRGGPRDEWSRARGGMRGMSRDWRRQRDEAWDEYRGYSGGLGDEPYYSRDDFRDG